MTSTASWLVSRKIGEYLPVHKFGENQGVTTTYKPICDDGIYRTPQVGGAIALRIKAGGDANDTAAGSGARKVMLYGIGADGKEIKEELTTNGISASSPTTNTFIRLYRIKVSESGSYADPNTPTYSHAAQITIEDTSGNEWGIIANTDSVPHGQSEIGCYTIPSELEDGTVITEAYLEAYIVNVDSSKTADVLIAKRESILDTSVPYQRFSIIREHKNISNEFVATIEMPLGPYPAGTDIIAMAKGSTTPSVGIDMEFILVKDPHR